MQNGTKLRSSISTSANINRIGESNKRVIKKKLAFSDDEILNDKNESTSRNRSSRAHLSDYETDAGYSTENLNTDRNKHKRGSSLTKITRKPKPSDNYDYKSIYEAFERPIADMTKTASSLSINNNSRSINNLSQTEAPNRSLNKNSQFQNYSNYESTSGKLKANKFGSNKNDFSDTTGKLEQSSAQFENYMDKEKIAAANAAAHAAASAIDKEKDIIINKTFSHNYSTSNNGSQSSPNLPKIINNFYDITKMQIEELPVIFGI